MKQTDATEQAYKNGYEQGKKDAVVRGWWDKKEDEKFMGYDAQGKIIYRTVYSYYCGRCALGTAVKTNYCAHCGAKMNALPEPTKGE